MKASFPTDSFDLARVKSKIETYSEMLARSGENIFAVSNF